MARSSVISFTASSARGSEAPDAWLSAEGQAIYGKLTDLQERIEKGFRQQARILRFEMQKAQRNSQMIPRAEGEYRAEPDSPTSPKRSDSGFSNRSETGNLADLPETEAVTPGPPEDPQSILTRSQDLASPSVLGAGRASTHSTASDARHRQRMSTRSAFSFTSYRSGKSVNTNTSRSRSGFTDASERTDQSSPDSLLHEVSRLHMAQAQIQGMWMLQRRASNFTPLEESCVQSYAINLVDSDSFQYIITFLILVHVILMGVDADAQVAGGRPAWLSIVNLVLVCIFLLELAIRFLALRCRGFWCGREWAWNLFDFIVIGVSAADVVLDLTLTSNLRAGQVRVFRLLRIFRYLRSFRVVRLFRYISALQVLILSIIGTMSSLAWTLALLLLIIYSYAVLLTELVAEHCLEGAVNGSDIFGACDEKLEQYWSSVPESMASLFMAISQGLNWQDIVNPLRDVSALAVTLVLTYVILTIFAILNVVTGVFCNTAIESASTDKDVRTVKQMQAKSAQVELLKNVFREIDFESENEISFQDVKRCLANGDLSWFLESMGISTDDVWTLFMLLDSDRTGLIDIDEFVQGCMQLHGPAKSMQVAKMSYENKLTRLAIKKLSKEVTEIMQEVQEIRKNSRRSEFGSQRGSRLDLPESIRMEELPISVEC